jgi:hypothetical protein
MYYYHARMTRNSESSHEIVVLHLGQDLLRKRVQPCENGSPIVIRGTTIPTDDLKQIGITRSQDHSSNILPIAQAERSQIRVFAAISDEWYVEYTAIWSLS